MADKLWMTMDQKDRQGLVLAVECGLFRRQALVLPQALLAVIRQALRLG